MSKISYFSVVFMLKSASEEKKYGDQKVYFLFTTFYDLVFLILGIVLGSYSSIILGIVDLLVQLIIQKRSNKMQ